MRKSKFLICLGATGGHIFPGLSIAEEIKKRDDGSEIIFINSANSNEGMPNMKIDYELKSIYIKGFVGKKLSNKFKSVFSLLIGTYQSIKIMKKFKPDFIIGTGGFTWLPISIAGFFLRKNIFIIEGNSVPGLSNRISSKVAKRIYIGFESARKFFSKKKTLLTGYPIRNLSNISEDHKDIDILVTGGSQGSNNLNLKFATQIESLIQKLTKNGIDKILIVHQTGINDYEVIKNLYTKLKSKYIGVDFLVEPFIDNIFSYLARTKILISRAGASTIFESFKFNLHSILVPLMNSTDNHQYKNAIEMKEKNLAEIWIEKEDLHKLTNMITNHLLSPENNDIFKIEREKMKKKNSANIIVEDLLRDYEN